MSQYQSNPSDNNLSCPACNHTHESGALALKSNELAAADVCPRCGFQYPSSTTPLGQCDQLVSDLEDYPEHTLSSEEVHRRLPALDLIENDSIREETARLSASAPAYFWTAPAASHKYHHPLCREQHGLWAHTLMVVQAVEDLLWTYQGRGLINEADADLARSAAILHDQRKNGPHADPESSSTSDHDLQMADIIIEDSDLPNAVGHAVATHMGPSDSYDGPAPESGTLNDLVHMADYAASRRNWEVKAPGPLPEELAELGVPEAES